METKEIVEDHEEWSVGSSKPDVGHFYISSFELVTSLTLL